MLGDEHLGDWSQFIVQRHYPAGSTLLDQDDTSQLFAIVLAGTIKLVRALGDGRQQIVGLVSAQDCLGECVSNESRERAECVTDVTLCTFPRKPFEAFLSSHPELLNQLLRRAMDELDQARLWILALGRKSAEERVATFILLLADKQRHQSRIEALRDDACVIVCSLKRREIAEFLGLSLETVSRQFTRLRTAGIINLLGGHRIEIKDLDGLRRLAEQEIC